MDDASWHLGYLDVKAGDWLHSRSVLVPTRWVNSVSWADHRVNLHHATRRLESAVDHPLGGCDLRYLLQAQRTGPPGAKGCT